MEIIGAIVRFFYWLYVRAWPVGLALVVYVILTEGRVMRSFPAFLVALLVFAGACTARFLTRWPDARQFWFERWRMLLTRKKEGAAT